MRRPATDASVGFSKHNHIYYKTVVEGFSVSGLGFSTRPETNMLDFKEAHEKYNNEPPLSTNKYWLLYMLHVRCRVAP